MSCFICSHSPVIDFFEDTVGYSRLLCFLLQTFNCLTKHLFILQCMFRWFGLCTFIARSWTTLLFLKVSCSGLFSRLGHIITLSIFGVIFCWLCTFSVFNLFVLFYTLTYWNTIRNHFVSLFLHSSLFVSLPTWPLCFIELQFIIISHNTFGWACHFS